MRPASPVSVALQNIMVPRQMGDTLKIALTEGAIFHVSPSLTGFGYEASCEIGMVTVRIDIGLLFVTMRTTQTGHR